MRSNVISYNSLKCVIDTTPCSLDEEMKKRKIKYCSQCHIKVLNHAFRVCSLFSIYFSVHYFIHHDVYYL